jgi:hypothetical protein
MANFINASIYGANKNDWNKPQGVNHVFPVNAIRVYPTSASYSGVTCVTVIEVLPTGLNQQPEKLYTDKTVAAILAQGNAPLA